MSIFASAALVITSLGNLGSQFVGVDNADKVSSENLAATVTSGAGSLGGVVAGLGGSKLVEKLIVSSTTYLSDKGYDDISIDSKEQAAAKAADAILWAITVVELLELTIGFGPPDEGGDLEAGSGQFTTLASKLASASPDECWQGAASQAYADQNAALQSLADTVAELDRQLAELVHNQGEWITHMRLGFGILKDLLLAAFAIELAIIAFVPAPGNLTAAKIFGFTVCALGVATALAFLGTVIGYSVENADKADQLATQYTAAAAAATLPNALTVAKVSSFQDVSASMSGMPATSEVLAGYRASPDERVALGAAAGADHTGGYGRAESPATPAFTLPTLSQLAQGSGQADRVSANVSPHAKLVNQTNAQLRQVAKMPSQRAAVPADELAPVEATPAGDFEDAGAALGAAAAQRAPAKVGTFGPQRPPISAPRSG